VRHKNVELARSVIQNNDLVPRVSSQGWRAVGWVGKGRIDKPQCCDQSLDDWPEYQHFQPPPDGHRWL